MAARNMAYEFRHSSSLLRVRSLNRVLQVLHSIQDLLSVFCFVNLLSGVLCDRLNGVPTSTLLMFTLPIPKLFIVHRNIVA